MAKTHKRLNKRSLFRELMSGVEATREHREGRLTALPLAQPCRRRGRG